MKAIISFVRSALRKLTLTIRFKETGFKKKEVNAVPQNPYFREEELKGMTPRMRDAITRARGEAGIPFYITGGTRTAKRNKEIGGSLRSRHVFGEAADIRSWSHNTHYIIVKALMNNGFNEIGLYYADAMHTKPSHIHGAIDPNQNGFALFTGVSK